MADTTETKKSDFPESLFITTELQDEGTEYESRAFYVMTEKSFGHDEVVATYELKKVYRNKVSDRLVELKK